MKKYRYFAMTAVAICALTAAAPAARAEGASTSMMENFMESIQQGMNEIQGWFTPVQDEAIGMGGQGDVAENTAIEVPPQLIEPAAGDASAIDMLNDAAEESMGVMDGEGIEGLGEGIDQGAMIQQTPTMERIEAQAMNNDGGLISVETVGENTQEAAMETIEETAEATPEMVEETVKEAVATETTTPTIEETIEETAKVVTEEIEETVEEIAEGATEAVEDTVADVAEEGTEEAAETTAEVTAPATEGTPAETMIEETAEAAPEMVEEAVEEAVATETTTPAVEETVEEAAEAVTEEIEGGVEEIATEATDDSLSQTGEAFAVEESVSAFEDPTMTPEELNAIQSAAGGVVDGVTEGVQGAITDFVAE